MRRLINLKTGWREQPVGITADVRAAGETGVRSGLVALCARCATGVLLIQVNGGRRLPTHVVDCLPRLVPRGVRRHDAQHGNGDAHIKAGLVGPSEALPLIDGELGLSTWQGIFFCEFDGPRGSRTVVCTVIADVGHTG